MVSLLTFILSLIFSFSKISLESVTFSSSFVSSIFSSSLIFTISSSYFYSSNYCCSGDCSTSLFTCSFSILTGLTSGISSFFACFPASLRADTHYLCLAYSSFSFLVTHLFSFSALLNFSSSSICVSNSFFFYSSINLSSLTKSIPYSSLKDSVRENFSTKLPIPSLYMATNNWVLILSSSKSCFIIARPIKIQVRSFKIEFKKFENTNGFSKVYGSFPLKDLVAFSITFIMSN